MEEMFTRQKQEKEIWCCYPNIKRGLFQRMTFPREKKECFLRVPNGTSIQQKDIILIYIYLKHKAKVDRTKTNHHHCEC